MQGYSVQVTIGSEPVVTSPELYERLSCFQQDPMCLCSLHAEGLNRKLMCWESLEIGVSHRENVKVVLKSAATKVYF